MFFQDGGNLERTGKGCHFVFLAHASVRQVYLDDFSYRVCLSEQFPGARFAQRGFVRGGKGVMQVAVQHFIFEEAGESSVCPGNQDRIVFLVPYGDGIAVDRAEAQVILHFRILLF